ncbi:hypothetical protein RH858_15865 [Halalkaliarchaeum sp. AArc-GB]|uniref:DUF7860 family protein n=1 Tax=Halalkaliarchaeum sp. AArc-GB TaxID=3074078 RepID=UPI002856FAA7|nr:hypothetical protein [Halalkaliarchaeum sp. AArc-GB]MDR5674603.1 hypothetical protein [Halalkaliarchaeum sp. AArc-GB]
MAGRYGDLNYGRLTKSGVAFGALLFAIGLGGELVGRLLLGGVSPFEDTLFVTFEFLGPVVAILAVLVFGIAMPLTE